MELRGCLYVCLCVVAVGGAEVVDLEEIDAQESTHHSHHYVELKEPTLFDAYFGKPVTPKRRTFLNDVINGTALCTVMVNPCDKQEGRRVDGTCINPHYPSKGATLTPMLRLLPPIYGPGNTLRPAKDGTPLTSTRVIRTTLLGDGYFADPHWSLLSTYLLAFAILEVTDLVYLLRYVPVGDCCINNQIPNPAGANCIPITVPEDDPYLRRTGIRCMNLTRVETYQDYGCISNMLPAARYSRSTPHLDLSQIYGNTEARSREIRTMQGGLLAFRMEGDREVPEGQSPFCINNKPPLEVPCYNFGDPYTINLNTAVLLPALWFFREHNRLARALAALNPCWDDEKLFTTARQINIAQWQYIFYYEYTAELMGYKNALSEGIITSHHGHFNDFDPHYTPGVYRDYLVGTRYFHTFMQGLTHLYRDHEYMGSRTNVDDSFRSGILYLNNTEADLTEGSIIQPCHRIDDTILDPDVGQRIFGELQRAADVAAIDMMRGRDAGLPPYNHYRKICGMKVAEHFDDFEDTVDKDKVEQLSRLYDDVNDVELMVAIYIERHLPHAFMGPTLYCIMTQNMLNWRKSDMYFFEHGDHPTALTADQLHAVKQTSIARIVCDNGDGIKAIQPKALFIKSKTNDNTACKQIPGIDLSYWKESKRCLPPLIPAPPVALPALPVPLPALPVGVPALPVGVPALPVGVPALPVGLPALPVGVPALPVGVPALPVGVPPLAVPPVGAPLPLGTGVIPPVAAAIADASP